MLSVHITITDRATPFLESLSEEMYTNALKDMSMAIARIIYDHAIETCPSPSSTHFPTESTGNLRDSHTWGPRDDGAFVQAEADYAQDVHEGHYVVGGKFGTRIHGPIMPTTTPSGKEVGKRSYAFIAPRPWMTIAIEMSSEEIQGAVMGIIDTVAAESTSGSTDTTPPPADTGE
jgi:hypothetical protein